MAITKSKIKVSFILGILNAERTLRECLDAILMQEYPEKDYEIIIADGGSKDKTLEIIAEYRKKTNSIRLIHNPHKLSEGRGNGKDMAVEAARGDIVIFVDHDNILLGKNWLREILKPFGNPEIMASQSMLKPRKGDSLFLQYVNALGVEDPFAIPYSLVAQVSLHPEKFRIVDNYYLYTLNPRKVLFFGANGCAFRKSVFDKIKGYTRDVDVSASMAEYKMNVAVPLKPRVYHKTGSNALEFMKKKGLYFYRFITNEYQDRKFRWIPEDLSGKIRFFLMVCYNLSIVGPGLFALKQFLKSGELFWILHPGFLFFVTLEDGLITLLRFGNFLRYA